MMMMEWVLQQMQRIFSLNTLEPNLPRKTNNNNSAGSIPRWKTPEFIFYAVAFVIVVPQMFATAHSVSVESHHNYAKYADLLSPGWIFGRKVDNSDIQYAGFRDHFWHLCAVSSLHLLASKAFMSAIGSLTGRDRADARVMFDACCGLLFIFGLHGISAFKILFILGVNYGIKQCTRGRLAITLTWVFNIAILFLNDWFQGYRLGALSAELAELDRFEGLLPRWEILFNFTSLRVISFNLDYIWAVDDPATIAKRDAHVTALTDKQRVSGSFMLEDYGIVNYLAYVLYPPLYLSGPILSFNHYLSQIRYPYSTLTTQRTLAYGLRLGFCILSMEILLHYTYVVAISRTKAWDGDTPFQLCMITYFNLQLIWLKLLIPWRFFRFWAMVDGIEAPENMIRCMSDNYSALAFWRAWHRSFNRWIIRYIYIPLGGSKHPIFNMLAVFTFVAFWHDISLKLLMWGWLITLFVLPEVAARWVFPPGKWSGYWYYRHLCALGASANILMMMIANLVGFSIGLDGVVGLLRELFKSYYGVASAFAVVASLFIATQVMFELREDEKRRGIDLRC